MKLCLSFQCCDCHRQICLAILWIFVRLLVHLCLLSCVSLSNAVIVIDTFAWQFFGANLFKTPMVSVFGVAPDCVNAWSNLSAWRLVDYTKLVSSVVAFEGDELKIN